MLDINEIFRHELKLSAEEAETRLLKSVRIK